MFLVHFGWSPMKLPIFNHLWPAKMETSRSASCELCKGQHTGTLPIVSGTIRLHILHTKGGIWECSLGPRPRIGVSGVFLSFQVEVSQQGSHSEGLTQGPAPPLS